MTTTYNKHDQPYMAEALHLLWDCVESGTAVPPEIEVELEDDNMITWTVDGLLQAARSSSLPLASNECEQYRLPAGSSHADLAEHISQTMTCNADSFVILDDVPARFPKRKEEPLPEEERSSAVFSDDIRSAVDRKEVANYLTEPVYRDGKATGEMRVYRIRYRRTFCTTPSSEIPWDMVLPTNEAADEWVRRVRKEEKQ